MTTPTKMELAEGLSEAQRRMVLESHPGGWGRDDTACGAELIGAAGWSTARALVRRKLGDIAEDYGMWPPGLYFNNQTGLAVRQYIQEQNHG